MPKKHNARAQALIYLAQREHSRKELNIKLLRKAYKQSDVTQALDILAAEGMQSDSRFIEDYIESRKNKNYGPERIRLELINKGLDKTDIVDGITASETDWMSCARLCYARKYKQKMVDSATECMQRKRYLYQRGYPEEIIRHVINEVDDIDKI